MADGQALPLGFIATRVEANPTGGLLDVTYPFVLIESEGRMRLAFGTPGPEPSVRDEITA